MAVTNIGAGFDRLAKPYRWMEYVSFGRTLQQCRTTYLSQLTHTCNALVLGDGDGRFAAALLHAAPDSTLVAVDSSAAMLRALEGRCSAAKLAGRLQTCHADLPGPLPASLTGKPFDVVATHFFLDCLSTREVEHLAQSLMPLLSPGAVWIVSDFAVPAGAMRVPARVLVRSLYLAFRLLTGLRVRHLPDHRAALERAGLHRVAVKTSLRGLLIAEQWRRAKP